PTSPELGCSNGSCTRGEGRAVQLRPPSVVAWTAAQAEQPLAPSTHPLLGEMKLAAAGLKATRRPPEADEAAADETTPPSKPTATQADSSQTAEGRTTGDYSSRERTLGWASVPE